MNTANMQTALASTISTAVAAGNMACLNQSRLVASLVLLCEGADAEANQFNTDVARDNRVAVIK